MFGIGDVLTWARDGADYALKYGVPAVAGGAACYVNLKKGGVRPCITMGALAMGATGLLTGGTSELTQRASKEAGATVTSAATGFGQGLSGGAVSPGMVMLLLAGLGALLIARS